MKIMLPSVSEHSYLMNATQNMLKIKIVADGNLR